jgi:hypothetical protein
MLNTNSARHQVVWIDEFDSVLPRLRKSWEIATSPEHADDSLPVSLVLNPEFASMSASSADESSPRGGMVSRIAKKQKLLLKLFFQRIGVSCVWLRLSRTIRTRKMQLVMSTTPNMPRV